MVWWDNRYTDKEIEPRRLYRRPDGMPGRGLSNVVDSGKRFFMEATKKEQKQLFFEFCFDCGTYLKPEQGKVIERNGGPVVLCPDCAEREMAPVITAADFEKKYQL